SSKSMLGHTLGAAGAIEAIVTTLSVYKDIVTPTINYNVPDPDLDLDFVPNRSRQRTVRAAMSNSFGFGGHNATLVIKKY
ncbi:MAG: 3-oxoacyl-acyl-carrier-protein synthase, partial [Clostridia bacterium]|nr:3-oxoacyl-acyl-carrier-protein synthase [Clostridia bacterium]